MLFLILAVTAVASATPLQARQGGPISPSTSTSKAFSLYVSITDPVKLQQDRFVQLNGLPVSKIRLGPGANALSISPNPEAKDLPANVWWQNDTTAGIEPPPAGDKYTILSDSGLQYYDAIDISQPVDAPNLYNVYLERPGKDITPGFAVGDGAMIKIPTVAKTGTTQLVVCDHDFGAYAHPQWLFHIFHKETDEGFFNNYVFESCVAVDLFAHCEKMMALPGDAMYTHDHAMEVACYSD